MLKSKGSRQGDFLGCLVVKTSPSKAKGAGLIPVGELRSHMLCSVAKQKIQATKHNAIYIGTSLWLRWQRSCLQCGRLGFNP